MADPVSYAGERYTLRAGAPMSVGSPGTGTFVVHTFMAEHYDVDLYTYIEDLPKSNQFRGQGGGFYSAQFNRLNVVCGDSFGGEIVNNPTYVDEDDVTNTGQSWTPVTGEIAFIDCTSLSISYDIMGIATISYTIVSNTDGVKYYTTIDAGNRTYTGYVANARLRQIPETAWYESNVTLISTTED